mmetsp:Transcript_1118/g.3085  ORF Transcript_1118/g.3085 Transcript_1118/m.3085 type:complete len:212 (-) Transcript_1118:153-788(-)
MRQESHHEEDPPCPDRCRCWRPGPAGPCPGRRRLVGARPRRECGSGQQGRHRHHRREHQQQGDPGGRHQLLLHAQYRGRTGPDLPAEARRQLHGARRQDRYPEAPAPGADGPVPLHQLRHHQALPGPGPELHALLQRGPAGGVHHRQEQFRSGAAGGCRFRADQGMVAEPRHQEGAAAHRPVRERHQSRHHQGRSDPDRHRSRLQVLSRWL